MIKVHVYLYKAFFNKMFINLFLIKTQIFEKSINTSYFPKLKVMLQLSVNTGLTTLRAAERGGRGGKLPRGAGGP
jgi:hypothetical protein